MNTLKVEPKHTLNQSTYPEYFVVEGKLLTNQTGINTYRPDQIEIITYFRLNGNSKPEENALVYLIETVDGSKGILIYRFDAFTDRKVYGFLKEYVDSKNRLYNGKPEIHASNMLQ